LSASEKLTQPTKAVTPDKMNTAVTSTPDNALTLVETDWTPEDAAAIRETARIEGLTVDELLRQCTAAALAAEGRRPAASVIVRTVDPGSLRGFPFFNTVAPIKLDGAAA
jgi:hypothetical protein